MCPKLSQDDPKLIPKLYQNDPKRSQNDPQTIPEWNQVPPSSELLLNRAPNHYADPALVSCLPLGFPMHRKCEPWASPARFFIICRQKRDLRYRQKHDFARQKHYFLHKSTLMRVCVCVSKALLLLS